MAPWAAGLSCIFCVTAAPAAAPVDLSQPVLLGLSRAGADSPDWANPTFEFRTGALFGIDGPKADKEGTPDVNLELLYSPFGGAYGNGLLNHLLRPRLHLGGTINTEGNTSDGAFYALPITPVPVTLTACGFPSPST
jgi:hypothetical protein